MYKLPAGVEENEQARGVPKKQAQENTKKRLDGAVRTRRKNRSRTKDRFADVQIT